MTDAILDQIAIALDNPQSDNSLVELPEDSPFDTQQRQWLNGLLTGINTIAAANSAAKDAAPGTAMSILYASQSGNCEVLSKDLKKYALTQGFDPVIIELNDFTLESLSQQHHVLFICSTFGEGEPPDNATQFFASLMADDAPALPPTLNFSVCGLGDSSYAHYNQCAIDLYERLTALGATPCSELQLCDLAFEDDYDQWKTQVFDTDVFKNAAGAAQAPAANDDKEPLYGKNRPFIANLIGTETLSASSSNKCVNHIEISLTGGAQDMAYEVGDALGVWPLNCPDEVNAILAACGFSGKEVVSLKAESASLRNALLTRLDLSTCTNNTLALWHCEDAPDDYEILDVLQNSDIELDAQALVDGLRPMQPRLYSIASSPKKHPGEVHLTVGEVHYDLHDSHRQGVASTWLGKRLSAGSNLGVYIQASSHFHLPENDDAPLIMIGPGTGVAPFRAFLEEREMRGAKGDNWLFFGDQHESADYLYRQEIEQWQASGLLNELSLAWSRDTSEKIYVQTLIKQQGEQFFNWLEAGAYIYVCGDATHMAADVDAAIHDIVRQHGAMAEADAANYIKQLATEHRYQRDVY